MVSDHTDLERKPHPVDARKVSRVSLNLPDDVYFEYGFMDKDGEIRADPEGPLPAHNPWYKSLSAVKGPAYQPSPYAGLESGLAKGRLERLRLESANLGQSRRLSIYTPEGFEDTPLPYLLVSDGPAFMRVGHAQVMLEALLQEGEIRPAHLVFIEPIDRSLEYRFYEPYRRFVIEEVIPLVEAEVAATDERILMGASLGGLVSASLALERPELFQTVISFSGAFLGSPDDPDPYSSSQSFVLDELRSREPLALRWYLEVGTLEWLHDINERIAAVLKEKGYQLRFEERHAGHNWTNWRNGLAQALRFALHK